MTFPSRALRADPVTEILFQPSARDLLMRAQTDVRCGVPVVIAAPVGALLILPVEGFQAGRLAAAVQAAGAELVLTRRRAAAVGLDLAGCGEAQVVRLACGGLTVAMVQRMVDPVQEGPAMMRSAAVAPVAGEALHEAGIALMKVAELLPALIAVPLAEPVQSAQAQGLTVLRVGDVLPGLSGLSPFGLAAAARVPMRVSEEGRVHVFRPEEGGHEHYAIEVGQVDRAAPVLVRLHSACFTGDVLGSLKCDCGPQLQAAMAAMAEAGGGVLLYLNQEGRGIGLANKMRAYALQDRGLDTVEANHHLGFEDDERDFRIGGALLARLGISAVRLMTNNPAKLAMLATQGLTVVERVPLRVGETVQNAGYLAVKARKSGHLLP